MAERLEKMLYGDVKQRIKVAINSDSEPMLESIKSTRRVANKSLCNTVERLKEALLEGSVDRYAYIGTKDNAADQLTKDMNESQDFVKIFTEGQFEKEGQRKVVRVVKREFADEIRLFEGGKLREDVTENKE